MKLKLRFSLILLIPIMICFFDEIKCKNELRKSLDEDLKTCVYAYYYKNIFDKENFVLTFKEMVAINLTNYSLKYKELFIGFYYEKEIIVGVNICLCYQKINKQNIKLKYLIS